MKHRMVKIGEKTGMGQVKGCIGQGNGCEEVLCILLTAADSGL